MARILDWFKEAKEDLKSAKILAKSGQYHHACFHAQQAAEKAVKAALLHFHVAKFGHSILKLLEELKKYVEVSEEIVDFAKTLDQYYIPSRYPNVFDKGTPSEYYSKRHAEEALKMAEQVIKFVEKIIGTHN